MTFIAKVYRMGRFGEPESFAEMVADTRQQAEEFISTTVRRADDGVVIDTKIEVRNGVEAEPISGDAGAPGGLRCDPGTETPPRDAERSAGGDDGAWFSS